MLTGNTTPLPNASDKVTVNVTVTNLRSSKGLVRACLTPDEKHFPDCSDKAAIEVSVAAHETVDFSFRDVSPGRYAIALLHDENENGKADRALFMMPKEGFGFSRDARVFMGPPRFKDAAFEVGHEPIHQAIRMRYML
nr:DUF2141 domain-containing protein [Altericroceibacterium spongiae]